jgi:dephospho-CoA kinase
MPVVGLSGGIAPGKSAIAAELRAQGAIVLSADDTAREVSALNGPALPEIAARFGDSVLSSDGSLDRPKLAARVFSDPSERRALEEITHPHILRLLREQIDTTLMTQPDAVVVVEVPLLFEAGMRSWFDMIVVVAAQENTQVMRLCDSRSMSRDEALARIHAQWPLSEKVANADYTVWNDDDLGSIPLRAGEVIRAIREHLAQRG